MGKVLWLSSKMQQKRLWGTLHPFVEQSVVMGRCVANEGFIRSLLQLDPYDGYCFYLPAPAAGDLLLQRVGHTPAAARGAISIHSRLELAGSLARQPFHCFHLSDPMTEQPYLAALRNRVAPHLFPITGVTHSLSYVRYASALLAHMWGGCTRRDAIVSTSRAGCGVVGSMFANLRGGYALDADAFPQPQVVRLPLGVDPAQLPSPDGGLRAAARRRLGVAAEPVLLVVGRIAHYAKMDLLPLFRMLRRAEDAGLPHDGYLLVIAGQADADDAMPALIERAGVLHGIRVRVVRSPDDAARNDLYAAADIFLSPSDNVQETFGLTLLEAGAAGLPVVASDWDGYRDLVLDGVTGLLVPTVGPADTANMDAAAPLLYDNQYHLMLAQQTAVEAEGFARAVAHLAMSPELRVEMGRAGRRHVLESFSWEHVVTRWVALWDALWSEPVDEARCRSTRHPLTVAYGDVFGGYPSEVLSASSRLRTSAAGMSVYRGREPAAPYPGVALLVPPMPLHRLLFHARKGTTVGDIVALLATSAPSHVPSAACDASFVSGPAGMTDAAPDAAGRTDDARVGQDGVPSGAAAGMDAEGGRADALTCEAVHFLILWALKHDLLERC